MNWPQLLPIIAVVIVPLIANVAKYLKQQAEVRKREQMVDLARREALRRGQPADQGAAPAAQPISAEAAKREELAAIVAKRRAQLAQAQTSISPTSTAPTSPASRPPTRPAGAPPTRPKTPNPFAARPAQANRPRQSAQRAPAARTQPQRAPAARPQQSARPPQRTAFRPASRQAPTPRQQSLEPEQETSVRVVQDAASVGAQRSPETAVAGRGAPKKPQTGLSIRSMLVAHEIFSPPISMRADRSQTNNPFDTLGY